MMGVHTACFCLCEAADETMALCALREQGAPVDEEILSKVSEISHCIDAIRDGIEGGLL